MKRAIFVLNGICMDERLDARMCEEALKSSGWTIVKKIKDADLILVYTCGVVAGMVNNSIKVLKKVQAKKRTSQELIVCGCLSKIDPVKLREVFNGSTFGPREVDQLKAKLKIDVDFESTNYNILREEEQWYYYHRKALKIFEKIRKFLKNYLKFNFLAGYHIPKIVPASDAFYIQTCIGCLGSCSYCAIRHAKGRLQSKPIAKVMEEFERGIGMGYKRFFLCADELGVYGIDIGTDLAVLLEEIISKKGDFELTLRELTPDSVFRLLPKLKPLFKTGKIKSITIPVQSGSDRILKLMRRNYTVEQCKYCISQLRQSYPYLLVSTTIMVGFPGETDDDFKTTVRLLDEVKFNMVDVANYSNRPGTLSSKMTGQVSASVRRRRARAIQKKALLNWCLGSSA